MLLGRTRLCDDIFGENIRQMMFADDEFNVHADFAGAAEDFENASGGREATFRISHDLNVDDGAIEFREARATGRHWRALEARAQLLPQFGSQLIARRNRDLVENAGVVGQNVISVRAVAEKADEGGVLAFDDLHDAAFGAAVRAAALDAGQHSIAVHRVAKIVATDEEIAVNARNRMFRDEKTVAVAVRDDAAGNQIRIAGAPERGCVGRSARPRTCGFGIGFGCAGGAARSGRRRSLLLG